MSSIGENIKHLRESHGMSQKQLAAMLGKSRSAVSQYESGVNIPRMGVIEDIAAVFRVSKSEILGESLKVDELSVSERELIAAFRSMDEKRQNLILENAKAFASL